LTHIEVSSELQRVETAAKISNREAVIAPMAMLAAQSLETYQTENSLFESAAPADIEKVIDASFAAMPCACATGPTTGLLVGESRNDIHEVTLFKFGITLLAVFA
jgi:hypothetical protein